MPSLQSYAVRGNHYWRIVESYRDKHGHPRLRVLRHLGTADKLLQLLSQAPGRPLCAEGRDFGATAALWDLEEFVDRKSTRLNSSHPSISYAVFCLKKKKKKTIH